MAMMGAPEDALYTHLSVWPFVPPLVQDEEALNFDFVDVAQDAEASVWHCCQRFGVA